MNLTHKKQTTNPKPYRDTFVKSSKIMGADRVGLVCFHDGIPAVIEPTSPYSPALYDRVQSLPTQIGGSGTNIAAGLEKAISILSRAPRGVLKRIFLLSDGAPNRDVEKIIPAAQKARVNFININTIAFCDDSGASVLQQISKETHNGKFFSVSSLRQLTDAIVPKNPGDQANHQHRAENTVFLIDVSGSMTQPLEGKTRIEVVAEALNRLLLFKQQFA